jgi:hypothetical protein
MEPEEKGGSTFWGFYFGDQTTEFPAKIGRGKTAGTPIKGAYKRFAGGPFQAGNVVLTFFCGVERTIFLSKEGRPAVVRSGGQKLFYSSTERTLVREGVTYLKRPGTLPGGKRVGTFSSAKD